MVDINPVESRWLLFIHQIPPQPGYLRVKVSRRLQRIGAIAIKNTVYALPKSEAAQEDFQWVLQEIVEGGGEATICDARFTDGLRDEEIEEIFQKARGGDYRKITDDARDLLGTLARTDAMDERRPQLEADLAKLKRRMNEVTAIDFFGAPTRATAEVAIAGVEESLQQKVKPASQARRSSLRPEDYRRRTWVTRRGIHVDRMASGWLIQRFIDKDACFKFVPAKGYRTEPDEVRFDMFEAEFTHEGDLCTFEVLLARFALEDMALGPIAEIVHDIDLKDSRFGRQDALGIERLVAGIALAYKEDEVRLERACAVLDDLHEYFKRKRGTQGGSER